MWWKFYLETEVKWSKIALRFQIWNETTLTNILFNLASLMPYINTHLLNTIST